MKSLEAFSNQSQFSLASDIDEIYSWTCVRDMREGAAPQLVLRNSEWCAVAWELQSQFAPGYMYFNIFFEGVFGKI